MAGASAEKGTISVRLVLEALFELRRQGVDEAVLLAEAGIDASLLAQPEGRVSSEAYAQLWLAIARQMDDEFFGMNPRRMKVGSFAYMARAAVKEPTLGSALQGALRFLHLVFDGFSPRLEVRDGLAAMNRVRAATIDRSGGSQRRGASFPRPNARSASLLYATEHKARALRPRSCWH